jgi:hypothetical protein
MEKLATGPEAADFVDLRLPVRQNLQLIARAKGVEVNQFTVAILERERLRADNEPPSRFRQLPWERLQRDLGDGCRNPAVC